MSAPEWVIVGRVRKVHGLQGELVVEPITDRPDAIFASGRRLFGGTPAGTIGRDRRELVVASARPFKGGFIVRFAGIDSREEAEKWRARFLLLPGEEAAPLEEGEVYIHELYGMRVELPDGAPLGVVEAVYELPQGLGLDVKRDGGGTVIIPWRDEVIAKVDREGRVLVVEPPEGLLD
ncbi:MAG TPA: ribosome maturation factor RimM [Gemmatimonadaceae bacterium]|nr:ribosome maturation factor RimM [Gemmatimonadaceae bacterium]